MEKFRGVDYYAIESLLSEEERMIRDAVRDWVEAEFLPLITDHHRAGTFPVELISKLGELGVFGGTPKGYGLAGAQQRRLRPDHAGARARRFRSALGGLG